MKASSVRILIVDDEPLARKRLQKLLDGRDGLEIVGEARDGERAVEQIARLEPDLVFLDIQMPGLDGFGVLAEVGVEAMPEVVFVTAFDEFALQAFAHRALDYLLKPFDDERFEQALNRALEQTTLRRTAAAGARLAGLLDEVRDRNPNPPAPLRRIAVSKNGRTVLVPVDEILRIESEGSYVRLHTASASHLLRDSIKRLEQALDPEDFLRIHRSHLVRIDQIVELAPLFHGESEVLLRDGARLRSSRSYRQRLRSRLGLGD